VSWQIEDRGFPVLDTNAVPSSFDGRVHVLEIDRHHPGSVWAGTQGDGLYHSSDSGHTWAHMQNQAWPTQVLWLAHLASVEHVLVSPASSATVYAVVLGCPYRSRDRGAQWQSLAPALPTGAFISDLAISPGWPHHLVAVVAYIQDPGLFKQNKQMHNVFTSDDDGTSWVAGAGLPGTWVASLTVDPTQGRVGYTVVESADFRRTTLSHTADGGHTWSRGTGLPAQGVGALVADPTWSQIAYAATQHGLFRTADGGATWHAWSGGVLHSGQAIHGFAVLAGAARGSAGAPATCAAPTPHPRTPGPGGSGRALPVGGHPLALAVDERAHRVVVTTQAASAPAAGTSAPGAVLLLDARTGARLHSTSVAAFPLSVAVDRHAGHVFVVSIGAPPRASIDEAGRGMVTMLDATSGASERTLRVGRLPVSVVVDEQTHRVFVANAGDDTVSVVDSRTGALVGTIQVGAHPWSLADDAPDHRVIVTTLGRTTALLAPTGAGTVSVLDATTGAVLATAATGMFPSAVAVHARAERAFITNAGSTIVTVLDTRSGSVVRTVTVGLHPAMTALSASAHHIVVSVLGRTAGLLHPVGVGTVDLLDARTGQVVRSLHLDTHPGPIAVDDQSRRAFVLNTVEGTVSVLDTGTGSLLGTIPLGPHWPTDGGTNSGIAVDLTTGYAFVRNSAGATVWMLDVSMKR